MAEENQEQQESTGSESQSGGTGTAVKAVAALGKSKMVSHLGNAA